MTKRLITAGLLVGTLSIIAQPVFAQSGDDVTEFVPQGEIAQAKDGPRQGWDGAFSLAANVSVSQNSHVVGQVDGFSLLLGVSLLGGLDYILDPVAVEWAVATRFQASEDMMVVAGAQGSRLDPSGANGKVDKMGLDATKPLDVDPFTFTVVHVPGEDDDALDDWIES